MSDEPATLQAILDRLVQVQAGQDQLRTGQDQLRTGQNQLRTGQDQFRSGVDELRVGVDELRVGVDVVRSELSQVHTEQGQLRDELANLHASLTRTRAEIMERVERMQNELTMHVEARVVDFATAERAERIAKDTQSQSAALLSSLSEQVNGMWRVIRRLESELRDLRGSAS